MWKVSCFLTNDATFALYHSTNVQQAPIFIAGIEN